MKSKLFLLSFALWALTFIIRLSIHIEPVANGNLQGNQSKVVERIIKSVDNGDNSTTFELIFTNNIKGCLINVLGGVLLSVATVINLLINGFAAADVFRTAYDSGVPLVLILKTTLPHSFELVGFWLSGMIGFMITWQLIRFMKGKEAFPSHVITELCVLLSVMTILIISAAYVEAFISINMMK
jgi:stage II sporulation protein M